jgi:uncharacterized 2Fe-2S/4Fe-4S cluster protein (DUF4445 family)
LSIRIHILPEGKTLAASRGEVLAGVLKKAGIAVQTLCGNRGICGTCAVEIVRGLRPRLGAEERALLARRKAGPRERLACRCRLTEDLTIRIPPVSMTANMPVLSRGRTRRFLLDPPVRKIRLVLPGRSRSTKPGSTGPDVRRTLAVFHFRPETGVLTDVENQSASDGMTAGPWTVVLRGGSDVMALEAGDTRSQNFGLAIDLGTTTLVVELVDLRTGRTLGREAGINPQISFGADVVSRISAAFGDPGQAEDLRTTILDGLNGMIDRLLARHGLGRERVYEAVVAGNTAMNHLFLGRPVGSLAVAPFDAAFSVLPPLPGSQAGLNIHPRGKVYVAPNIRSFVGGDISAGLIATGFDVARGTSLFVDLGTNGEIVLKTARRFVATSTAAGPAFEGMTIGCGMLAEPGAVFGAEDKDGFRLRTIGGLPPRGVCGTGLIDLLAIALKRGLVTAQGRITGPGQTIELGAGLKLEQRDVREFQLAAAAVKTGWRLLLEELRVGIKDVDRLVVAGAFGNSLNVRNAVALGLLPRLDPKKIVFVGNASLAGARVLLLSVAERRRCERLVRRICHINLAHREDFQTMFIDALAFGPWV